MAAGLQGAGAVQLGERARSAPRPTNALAGVWQCVCELHSLVLTQEPAHKAAAKVCASARGAGGACCSCTFVCASAVPGAAAAAAAAAGGAARNNKRGWRGITRAAVLQGLALARHAMQQSRLHGEPAAQVPPRPCSCSPYGESLLQLRYPY